MQSTIHSKISEAEVAFEDSSTFMYSELYIHPTMGTCPSHTAVWILIFTNTCWYTQGQSLEHQFPPRKTKFLSYQGCIFFVSNKLQNEICPSLIISNAVYSLISELLMVSKQKSGSLKILCVYQFFQASACLLGFVVLSFFVF